MRLIIFDLDGVLVDSRPLHYRALNLALEAVDPRYVITPDEHHTVYDGLPTREKLRRLTASKGLPPGEYDRVWRLKQEFTVTAIKETVQEDSELITLFQTLKSEGFLLYCASNSIWNTVKMILMSLGVLEYIDYFLSNEEVKNPKPSPEMYLHCIARAGVSARETLICEDSPVGRTAALASGAWLCPIIDRSDVTLKKLRKYIKEADAARPMESQTTKWMGPCNIVIPMAGNGSRFAQAGYTFPKPLIEVKGKPMVQVVIDNLNIEGTYIFIVQKEHSERYSLPQFLTQICPGCKIVTVDHVTEGAACSVLLAQQYIDSATPLVIANSDQFLEWNAAEFMYCATAEGVDSCISTFYNTHPKWSYARLGADGWVAEVQEKNPISTTATTGIYFWRHGSDFVKYAQQMIARNIRINNEFYVCPVFNEAIADGKKIKIMPCRRMWGLGTPEDLTYFLAEYKGSV